MTERMRQFYFWAPRGLGLLVALFFTGLAIWATTGRDSIAMSVATLVFFGVVVWLIALAISWRWELAGLLLFTGSSVWLLVSSWSAGTSAENLGASMSILWLPIIIGLLFLLDWYVRRKPIVSTGKLHDRGETLVQKK